MDMQTKIIAGVLGGSILVPAVLGIGAWQAGERYKRIDSATAVTAQAGLQREASPRLTYPRNLSEEVFHAVRSLDHVYRSHYGRGLPIFHLGNDHYVVVRASYGNAVAEAYLKASKWGIVYPNTPITLVVGNQSPDLPSLPLLLTSEPHTQFVDEFRHGTYKTMGFERSALPDLPEPEIARARQQTIERGLDAIVSSAKAETGKLAADQVK